jgi:uncharacterized SAM-binding protein YcdF (DUF218 family)
MQIGARPGAQRWAWAGVLLLTTVLAVVGFRQLGVFVSQGAALPAPADAIAVLGGDDGHRVLKGIALWRAGLAPNVVLTGIEGAPAETREAYFNWRARKFLDAGVAEDALVFDDQATNSFEEAAAVLALMKQHGWRQVLVVSDPPHMRRLGWTWDRVFAGSGLSFSLVASEPNWWDADHWWRSEKAGQFVLTEVVKMGYYLVKYGRR